MQAPKRAVTVAAVVVATMTLAVVAATVASAEDDGGKRFSIALSGVNEVPENPHGDADRGSVALTLNQGEGRVCWRFGELTLTAGEPLPFAAHIHVAPAGVAGPVVVTLFGPATAPTAYPTDTVCVAGVDPTLIKEIRKNPSDYYVNAHNTTHPPGVVRGQLG